MRIVYQVIRVCTLLPHLGGLTDVLGKNEQYDRGNLAVTLGFVILMNRLVTMIFWQTNEESMLVYYNGREDAHGSGYPDAFPPAFDPSSRDAQEVFDHATFS